MTRQPLPAPSQAIFENRPLPPFPVGATLCSGIGAPEVSCPDIDWRFASEIDPFPRDVLQARLGYMTPENHTQGAPLLWGDLCEVTPATFRDHGLPLPDVLVAGTPCQAFSLAGARRGLEDPRGNLTLKFVTLCHAIQEAKHDRRLAVVWENVPGVLSDQTNAFGAFLSGIVGGDDPFPRPFGRSWPGAGLVAGPRGRAAWRVLNAEYFGVAQRRRRVFLVASLGDGPDPAAVLFEPRSLQGHSAPRRGPRKNDHGDFARGAGGGRGAIAQSGDVAYSLTRNGPGSNDWETAILLATSIHGPVAHTLTAGGADASEDGTGRGTPIVAFSSKDYGQDAADDISPTLRASGGYGANAGGPPAVAYAIQERATAQNLESGPRGAGYQKEIAYTLEARQTPQNVAYSVALRGRDGGVAAELGGMVAGSLTTSGGGGDKPHALIDLAVRRLTPRECHRLQGFPDHHCAIERRGKPAADGPQYKALGNSMAVPVMGWILGRLLGHPVTLRPHDTKD